MKRFLTMILAAAMLVLMFAGCKNNDAVNNDPDAFSDAGDNVVQSDADYITDKGEMLIGITLFAPMNYYDETNTLVGFETEFANEVCKRIGVTPKFVEIDWKSKEIELEAKNIDCIWNGMTITDELKENLEITVPYMENKQVMIVKEENLEKYTASIIGASVVAEQGSAGESLVTSDDAFKDVAFTAVASQANALMDVASGTADIAVVDYVLSIGSIGEGTDFEDLVVVESEEFGLEQYGIAFRKGSDMATVVNNTIEELMADGTLEAIADKYKLKEQLVKA